MPSKTEVPSGRLGPAVFYAVTLNACFAFAADVAADGAPDAAIVIRAKFVEIASDSAAMRDADVLRWLNDETSSLEASTMDELVRKLTQAKGVHIAVMPLVTTRPAQKATVHVTREFIYPTEFTRKASNIANEKPSATIATPVSFEMLPVGVILDATPEWVDRGTISIRPLVARLNEFDGFARTRITRLKRGGKGKWLAKDVNALPAPAEAVPPAGRQLQSAMAFKIDDVFKLINDVPLPPDEVRVPVFATLEWKGRVTLKAGSWHVAPLSLKKGRGDCHRDSRVWIFVTAGDFTAEAWGGEAVIPPEPEKNLFQKARGIILPRVEFQNAKVRRTLEILRAESLKLDPTKQGLNYILHTIIPNDPVITLSLRDAPLSEAVRTVCELGGLDLKWEDYAVFIRASTGGGTPEQYTRVYKVPENLMGGETDAKKWLAAKGIVFTEGAGASFDGRTSKLTVKHVRPELNKVEAILQRQGITTEVPKPAIMQRADKIIFPSISFRNATLGDAVEFLRVKSRDFDREKRGVNIVLAGEAAKVSETLTLELNQVPLSAALNYVVSMVPARIIPRSNSIDVAQLFIPQPFPDWESPIVVVAKKAHTDWATGIYTASGEVTTEIAGMSIKSGSLTYDRKTGVIELTNSFEIRKGKTVRTSVNDRSRAFIDAKTGAVRMNGPTKTKITE